MRPSPLSFAFRLLLTLIPATGALLPCQTPRTAREALERFAETAAKPESQRVQAAGWLGRHDDPEVTEALLVALREASDLAYRRALVRALGQQRRPGTVPDLRTVLEATDNHLLRTEAARAIGAQGGEGVAALGELLGPEPEKLNYNLLTALLDGLSEAGLPEARGLIVRVAQCEPSATRLAGLRRLAPVADDPRVTDLRLAAAGHNYLLLAAEGLEQLARHRHERSTELALKLHERARTTTMVAVHRVLVEVLAREPRPPAFQPLLEHAAALGSAVSGDLAESLAETVRDTADLQRWLQREGLRRPEPDQRRVAILLLGDAPGDEVTKALAAQLMAKEPTVVSAAARALARRGDDLALSSLRKLLSSSEPGRRIEALLALHKTERDGTEWERELLRQASHRDSSVQAAALDLLADVGSEAALPKAWDAIDHRAWQVRAAAIDFLRRVRSTESIPRLIARVEREDGRLHHDVLDALQSLTLRRFWTAAEWRRWWKEEAEGFELPPLPEKPAPAARRPGQTVSYYNIPLVSQRVVFVLDVSGSMASPLGTGGNRTRLDEAKRQLHRVLDEVDSEFAFNMVFFQTTIEVHTKTMQKASDRNKVAAREAVDALKAAGGTNVHDGLETAFQDPNVDTVYLLTDGFPSAGPITDPQQLADEVARWNRARRIRIHCIAVGSKSPLLERLAAESGGEFVWVR